MNTTAKVRLINPQQQMVQSGASDWPGPSPSRVAALMLMGQSVGGSRAAALPGTLTLGSGEVIARDGLDLHLVVCRRCGRSGNHILDWHAILMRNLKKDMRAVKCSV